MLKNVLKNFQMSEQNWGCLDKMSEVNFSPAETLWESDKNTRKHHIQENQEVSPFPAGEDKAARHKQDK